MVAALMKRMVIIGVRKTATPLASASSSRALGGFAAREMTTHGIALEKSSLAFARTSSRERLLR
jgi:hypothetical protein